MASTYKTPGVYVEEISKLPASVAQVETAIPAFIGYTEIAEKNGKPITGPVRISSMLDYETFFGGPYPETDISVTVNDNGVAVVSKTDDSPKFAMHYAMQMFFANGGGDCYIVSVGGYYQYDEDGSPVLDPTTNEHLVSSPSYESLESGLSQVRDEDEPTLILFPDATSLDKDSYYQLYQVALDQCKDLGDRFVILDVKEKLADDDTETPVDALRNRVANNLLYGAAYYPYLETTLSYHYKAEDISVTTSLIPSAVNYSLSASQGDTVLTTAEKTKIDTDKPDFWDTIFETDDDFKKALAKASGISSTSKAGKDKLKKAAEAARTKVDSEDIDLDDVHDQNNQLYNLIKKEIALFSVTLPPSSAIAGIYSRVDNDRGVWKAPANIGVTGVRNPTIKITNDGQESLNVDVTGGKSINAIRVFLGKGILVWGSRTLDGNSNEWRYVPVRRFFNMVEESVKKSSAWVVFEPNDANTWVKVKAMIENYLIGLWKAGALAGSVPEEAFYVNVGLGTTMTSQDILEGRMIIEIGMAAVRPAEFIILRFSHKIQES